MERSGWMDSLSEGLCNGEALALGEGLCSCLILDRDPDVVRVGGCGVAAGCKVREGLRNV